MLEKEIYAYSLDNAMQFGKAKENAVLQKLFRHGLKSHEIKKIMPQIKGAVKKVNSMKDDARQKDFGIFKIYIKEKEVREGLKELPYMVKKPIFRVAPFPSGALHIGNAKTFVLNSIYAKKNKGKVLLVMDDTMGSEEKQILPESYKLIEEDIKLLQIKYSKPIIYKSKRLKTYYKYARELIQKGMAYVCECSIEELRGNRKKGVECPCRQYSPKDQLKKWKKMFGTKAEPGKYTLRIKTDMQHKNPAFRDRVLLRITEREHPLVGKKYKVWPMLEFSWAIDDYLLGITHIIRGKDLVIESDMERYIWKIFGWKQPVIMHTGLINIQGIPELGDVKISKSKAQKEVKSGKFTGWDDPRTWSIKSLIRRGILTKSFRQFVEEIGLNQNDITVPIDALYAINRKNLDKKADRYFFIENPVEIKLSGEELEKIRYVSLKLNPAKKTKRDLKFDNKVYVQKKDFEKFVGKEVRLMGACNIKMGKNKKAKITSTENKKIQNIHWIAEGVNAKVLMPNGKWVIGLAEPGIKKLQKNQIIQFERTGFCRFDKKGEGYEFWFAHM